MLNVNFRDIKQTILQYESITIDTLGKGLNFCDKLKIEF
jgi:hypothetical protein